jgi:ribosomal protein S18 acetylase RimI-like enzyme
MGVICEELYGDCSPFVVVENMIVDKSRRRAGVGRALMAELEERARQRGCAQMLLVTEKSRTDACSFYESAGFAAGINAGYKKKL